MSALIKVIVEGDSHENEPSGKKIGMYKRLYVRGDRLWGVKPDEGRQIICEFWRDGPDVSIEITDE